MIYEDDAKIILKQDCDWANLRNKTILISGATGLLGSVLTDMFSLLNEKFSLNLKLLLISRNPSLVSAVPFINYIAHDINLSLNNINFELLQSDKQVLSIFTAQIFSFFLSFILS